MSFFQTVRNLPTAAIDGVANAIKNMDYQKQVLLPLVIACLPGVSMLVTKIRSEHLQTLIRGSWDGLELNRHAIRAFENDRNVKNFKLLRMVEDMGLFVQKIALAALTLLNPKLPVPVAVCLFLAGNALYSFYESRRIGVPVLSFNDEANELREAQRALVANPRTLVLFG